MPYESKIEQDHRADAIADGWFVEKIERTTRGGFPDRFYAKAGRVVLIEWKRPGDRRSGGKLSKQQELRHRELRAAGVEVYVVDSVDEANRILGIRYFSEVRTCLCGCGRRFRLNGSDHRFAFDACRVVWERRQRTNGL